VVIVNPLQPGSVTTDIIKDGAVTCVKTNFSTCELTVYKLKASSTNKIYLVPYTGPYIDLLTPSSTGLRFYAGDNVTTNPGFEIWPSSSAYAGITFKAGANSGDDIHFRLSPGGSDALVISQGTGKATFNYDVGIGGVVTLTTPLSVLSGGTGTSTPGLIAGTGISITGTWPNQTINNTSAYATLADPLPVLHGGTGSTTLGSNIPTSLPVPISEGGTGTTTPGLVAGSNISITGTWPNQTINADNQLVSPVTISGSGNQQLIIQSSSIGSAQINLVTSNHVWYIGNYTAGTSGLNVYDKTNELLVFQILTDDTINIVNTISKYNGDTTVGGGVPAIVAQGTQTNINTVTTVCTFTPAADGFYKVSFYLRIVTTGTGNALGEVTYKDGLANVSASFDVVNAPGSSAGGLIEANTAMIYVKAGTPIVCKYEFTSTAPTVDLAAMIERC